MRRGRRPCRSSWQQCRRMGCEVLVGTRAEFMRTICRSNLTSMRAALFCCEFFFELPRTKV